MESLDQLYNPRPQTNVGGMGRNIDFSYATFEYSLD